MKRKRVFVTGSLWSLFIYLMYSNEDEIENTKYFFTDCGIHSSIRKNLKCYTFNTIKWENLRYRYRLILLPILRLYYRFKFPYLFFAEIYGIDQGVFVQSIIGNKKYVLIEDGLADYEVKRKKIKKWNLVNFFYGIREKEILGNNSLCKKIILTQSPTNDYLANLSEVISIKDIWNTMSESKKNKILEIFNIDLEDISIVKKYQTMLLTQPFSEYGKITEDEKIELYRQLIAEYSDGMVLIKPHPREVTDYNKYFENVFVYNKIIPAQFFELLGVKFKRIVTVSSTAIFEFSDDVEKIFTGNRVNEKILKSCGEIMNKRIK